MASTTKSSSSKFLGNPFKVTRISETSATNTELILSTPTGKLIQVLWASTVYSAASSTTVLYTLNSGVAAGYDVKLESDALSSATESIFTPNYALFLADDDTLDVTAPQLSGQTSSIAIYFRVYG